MEETVRTDQYSVMSGIENNNEEVQTMVMDSYQDMLDGKGRDYKEFFRALESRYRGKNAVLLSEDDWNAIQETLYLNSVSGMAESIIEAKSEPIEHSSIYEEREVW